MTAALDVRDQIRQRGQVIWTRKGSARGNFAELVDFTDIRP